MDILKLFVLEIGWGRYVSLFYDVKKDELKFRSKGNADNYHVNKMLEGLIRSKVDLNSLFSETSGRKI